MINYDFKSIQDYIIGIRRSLHKIPEVGIHLPNTQKYVMDRLDELNIEYKKGVKDSSLIALIKGTNNTKTVGLRADMDALAIKEETGLSFSSENDNMHSCGHDAHTAILLGAAKILSENKDKINGNIKLLFQTGEETCEGAKILIEEGALENPKVDYILGTHVGGLIVEKRGLNGVFQIQEGPLMASYDKIILKVRGLGCHGAFPHTGVDPLIITSNIVLALQSISSREISASESVVISFCSVHGGTAYNIIPDEIVIEGTIRALSVQNRQKLVDRIGEISSNVAKAFRGSCDMEVVWGAPPVVNNEKVAKIVRGIAEEAFGKDSVIQEKLSPMMGGEDIALLLQEVPGTFFFFATEKSEDSAPHHNSKFDVQEEKLYMPVELMVRSALHLLSNNNI